MDKAEYTKLLVCLIVMLAGMAVPYTGTCLMALLFVCIIQFGYVTDCLIRLINSDKE
jgi:hypothetical protein